MVPLPIDAHLPSIQANAAQHKSLVISAAPGSGKTTRVAPAILEVNQTLYPNAKRVVLLQPRRVAVRAAAERIASERGWQIGQQIGYQVRFEKRVSDATRLLVATEGVLVRQIQSDPLLESVSTVIFDEFHERRLESDLLLGMIRQLQDSLRDDLRIVVMSATLGQSALESYFQDVGKMDCQGHCYDVQTKYRAPKAQQHSVDHVAETIRLTCQKGVPDILVFLPGVGEIAKVDRQIRPGLERNGWEIVQLHGQMKLEDQMRVLRPSGLQRIVLATNVAETSLTLDGIRTVIDSGLARVLRFDPAIGLNRLSLEPITQDSASQRTGRAGRLSEGTCVRLWSAASHRSRAASLEPEILRVDLASAMLQLYQWGEGESDDFPWLDPPRTESVAAARLLLQRLGATDEGKLTQIGQWMAMLPAAPRLARLMIFAHQFGFAREGCLIAAMLGEREPFLPARDTKRLQRNRSRSPHGKRRFPDAENTVTEQSLLRSGSLESDVLERLEALEDYFRDGVEQNRFGEVHRGVAQQIQKTASQFESILAANVPETYRDQLERDEVICRAVLAGFPDRVVKRRMAYKPQGLMVGGKGVRLSEISAVKDADLFVCVETHPGRSNSADALIQIASQIEMRWLDNARVETTTQEFFHPTQLRIVGRKRVAYLDLILHETPAEIRDAQAAAKMLFEQAKQRWEDVFPASDAELQNWISRVGFIKHWLPAMEFPAIDEAMLDEVLLQLCRQTQELREIKKLPWMDWIQSHFSAAQLEELNRLAPEAIPIPSGRRVRLEYRGCEPPILAAKIQELFGLRETPTVAGGRVKLLVHLLAPNNRPQQITDDLPSFWSKTYQVVRKELRRRYSKHDWPEDPMNHPARKK